MWDYVGVVRDTDRLRVALKRLSTMAADAEQWVQHYAPDPDLYELRNVTRLGEIVIRCALFRAESRGLHYVADYPEPDEAFLGDTHLRRDAVAVLHPLAFQARGGG
jgi:L-aspartate oxidase